MKLNKEQILEYQQNRPPYLMIDPLGSDATVAYGYKDLKEDEWFFKVHWPKDPKYARHAPSRVFSTNGSTFHFTLPGNKGKIMYLMQLINLKFLKKILPNTRLQIETKVKSYKRGIAHFAGEGIVNKDLACRCRI